MNIEEGTNSPKKLKVEVQGLLVDRRMVTIRDVNDILILASYSGLAREKLEFGSIIVEPSSSYRANRV